MLSSLIEADDAVQEVWLHLSRSDAKGSRTWADGWATVVAGMCLDTLRSRKSRRGEALAAHVPDPIVTHEGRIDPEKEALIADSVGLAFLVVLLRVGPCRAPRIRISVTRRQQTA